VDTSPVAGGPPTLPMDVGIVALLGVLGPYRRPRPVSL